MLYIMPTIDVEAAHGSDPFAQMIEGRGFDHEDWGVYRQARIFRSFGVRAVFFVDVYEAVLWGERNLAELCQRLAELDQDVQLHTHPSWRSDPRDSESLRRWKRERCLFPPELDFMAKLSRQQQIDLLGMGCDWIEKWLGYRPIAHRSGGYSINRDTIAALAEVGIPLDSSMHPASPNTRENWGTNVLCQRAGVLEFPVTVMRVSVAAQPGLRRFSKLLKTDIDSVSAAELIGYADAALAGGPAIMNLFMHSYSLLEMNADFSKLRGSRGKEAALTRTLAHCCATSRVRFVDASGLLAAYQQQPDHFAAAAGIPVVPGAGTLGRLTWRRLRRQFPAVRAA